VACERGRQGGLGLQRRNASVHVCVYVCVGMCVLVCVCAYRSSVLLNMISCRVAIRTSEALDTASVCPAKVARGERAKAGHDEACGGKGRV
jgi:hypothetical protein